MPPTDDDASPVLPDGRSATPPRPTWKRRLGRVAALLLVAFASWVSLSYYAAVKLVGRHGPIAAEPVPKLTWVKFAPIRLKTSDSQSLGAWYHPGDLSQPCVLFLHGNGGNRSQHIQTAEFLARRGMGLLLVTLRAHGDSTGDFNDIGYSARLDVLAAADYLNGQTPGRKLVILGSSLGAAAAIFAAKDLDHRASGYILESPYTTLKEAVKVRTVDALPMGLGWVAYAGLLFVSPWVIPDVDRISPVDVISSIPDDLPILLMAGGRDVLARPEKVRTLYDKVSSHARFEVFATAGHLGFLRSEPDRYQAEVLSLIDRAVANR